MINIGDSEIAGVYVGDIELSVYAGDELIYPLNFGTLTGISLDNLTWVTDVPASGGTATSANCSYTVTGYYDSGKTRKLNSQSTITGYLDVPETSADTRQMVGTLTLTASCSGFTDSDTVDVYQEKVIDYSQQYLTIEALTDGVINWCSNNNTTTYRTIEYSKNEGEWTSITSSQNGTNISVVAGDKLRFKGNYVTYSSSSARFGMFGDGKTTAEYNVYGNIMSLVYGDNFIGQTVLTGTYNFRGMFCNTNVIKDASNLILPATTLSNYCYYYMFLGSQSLTAAPELPATTLSNYCYYGMFYNCKSLTSAPDLPATTLVTNCYRQMFQNCTSLNYIKCLATSGINTSNSTSLWVSGVASTGTFVKATGVTWPSGNNGIPNTWTVQEV